MVILIFQNKSATVPLGMLGVFDPLLVRFGSLGPLSFWFLRGRSPPVSRLPQLPHAMFCTFFQLFYCSLFYAIIGTKSSQNGRPKNLKKRQISQITVVNADLETTPEKTQKIGDFESLQMLLNRAETAARTPFSRFQGVKEKSSKMSQKVMLLGTSGHQKHRKVRKSDPLKNRQKLWPQNLVQSAPQASK